MTTISLTSHRKPVKRTAHMPRSAHSQAYHPTQTNMASIIQRVAIAPQQLMPSEVMTLQRMIGNAAVARLMNNQTERVATNSPVAKPSTAGLQVGAAGDRYEQEADRIASKVAGSQTAPLSIQRAGTTEVAPQVGAQGGALDAQLTREFQNASRGGQPVPEQVRKPVEQATGADLRNVRVHSGSEAQAVNGKLGAKASTHKNHILLGKDQSPNDKRLMAHELTHTIQQGAAGGAGAVQRQANSNLIQREGGFFSEERMNRRNQKFRHSKFSRGVVGATSKVGAAAAKLGARIKTAPVAFQHGAASLEGMSVDDLAQYATELINSKPDPKGINSAQHTNIAMAQRQGDKDKLIKIIILFSVSHNTRTDIAALASRANKQKMGYTGIKDTKQEYKEAKQQKRTDDKLDDILDKGRAGIQRDTAVAAALSSGVRSPARLLRDVAGREGIDIHLIPADLDIKDQLAYCYLSDHDQAKVARLLA